MNQREFETIAEVFARHRAMYGGRTDSVVMELIEDMADALEYEYPKTFIRDKFMEACNVAL